MKFEQDEVRLLGGVRHGQTQGGPVAIEVANTEWPKWEQVMSADPVDPADLEGSARNAPLTRPRPGHADLVGHAEVRLRRRPAGAGARLRPRDRRPGRPRAGSRATSSPRPSARGSSRTSIELGGVRAPDGLWPRTTPTIVARLDDDPVRCLDPDTSKLMVERIDQAHRTATPSAASSRSWCTGCRPASARTCTGTGASTRGWPAR